MVRGILALLAASDHPNSCPRWSAGRYTALGRSWVFPEPCTPQISGRAHDTREGFSLEVHTMTAERCLNLPASKLYAWRSGGRRRWLPTCHEEYCGAAAQPLRGCAAIGWIWSNSRRQHVGRSPRVLRFRSMRGGAFMKCWVQTIPVRCATEAPFAPAVLGS